MYRLMKAFIAIWYALYFNIVGPFALPPVYTGYILEKYVAF